MNIKVAAAVVNQTPLDWLGNRSRLKAVLEQAREEKREHKRQKRKKKQQAAKEAKKARRDGDA